MEQIFRKMTFSYYIVFLSMFATGFAGHFLSRVITIDSMGAAGIAMQSIAILVLLLCLPLGMKIHSTKVKELLEKESEEEKVLGYVQPFNIRLIMIAAPLLISVLFFYLLQETSMLFCGGIAAVALIYCKPVSSRILRELEIGISE